MEIEATVCMVDVEVFSFMLDQDPKVGANLLPYVPGSGCAEPVDSN